MVSCKVQNIFILRVVSLIFQIQNTDPTVQNLEISLCFGEFEF
jgi:hypothetical protein